MSKMISKVISNLIGDFEKKLSFLITIVVKITCAKTISKLMKIEYSSEKPFLMKSKNKVWLD